MDNPMGEMVQHAAIENIGKYLPRAVNDGSDMEARDAVAFANTMSGYGIEKDEAMKLAKNARTAMGMLFRADPARTTDEEIAGIFERAWK